MNNFRPKKDPLASRKYDESDINFIFFFDTLVKTLNMQYDEDPGLLHTEVGTFCYVFSENWS